jgi:hypothetical protein
VFLWLLVSLFMLGMLTAMTVYELFRLHRVDWAGLFLFLIFGVTAFRNARLIYRRLG